jgi:DNA-binding MarR family transcriptional regulator
MARMAITEAETVFDRFIEALFRLMMDHDRQHILETDLTAPQAQALRVLRREPLCTRDLAAALRISPPAVTQLTDRLVRKHLLERQVADGDRRSVIVSLTEKGKRTVDGFRERRNRIFSVALAQLTEDDRAQVVVALDKVVTALEETVSGSIGESRSRASLRIEVHETKTAVQPATTSNRVGQGRAPAGGKMKLEWD